MKKIIVTCILFTSLFLGVCFGFKSNAYTLDDNGNLISDNLFNVDSSWYYGFLEPNNGDPGVSDDKNYVVYENYIAVTPGEFYTQSTSYSILARVHYYDINKNWLQSNVYSTFEIPSNARYIRVVGNRNIFTNNYMLNVGTTAKPYELFGIWYSSEWLNDSIDNAYENGYDMGYGIGYDTGKVDGYQNAKNEEYNQFADIFRYSTLLVSYSTTTGNKIAYQGGVLDSSINDGYISLFEYQEKVIYNNVSPANATRLDLYFNNGNGIYLQPSSIYLEIYDGEYMTQNDHIVFNLGYNNDNNNVLSLSGSYLKLVSGSSTGLGRWVLTLPTNIGTSYVTQLVLTEFNTSAGFYVKSLYIANNGLQVGYGQGFNAGYLSGIENGKEQGYNDGFENGKIQGYQNGYSDGYTEGSGSDNTLVGMMFAIVDAPFQILKESMNFNFLGVNISEFLFSLITLIVVVKIFKMFF